MCSSLSNAKPVQTNSPVNNPNTGIPSAEAGIPLIIFLPINRNG